ncbi:Zinc/iron permease [Basidiobolus meristosporus CBS 931.73]|uniref:Zinc/iron permease n=1 Tax=Basidiobolus meristosporus CBS 931.73 TaxID=1314790 RepID=A0A1Y1WQ25_9FUNG|nr:Zinc/iron permease [Basidiobolus meristosporus CBS 931.73]|eukprot:ORX75485.1 Zinc/iron permease [Basidiobolus meristosporus CBS 931.73]
MYSSFTYLLYFLGCTALALAKSAAKDESFRYGGQSKEEYCSQVDAGEYDVKQHVIGSVAVLLTSIVGVFLPFFLIKVFKIGVDSFPINLGRHFGTGVVISTGFVHMMPEAIISLTHVCQSDFFHQYPPLAGAIAMCAALINQLLEYLVSDMTEKSCSTNEEKAVEYAHVSHHNNTQPNPHGHGYSHGGIHSHSAAPAEIEGVSLRRRKLSTYMLEFGIWLHSVPIGITLGVTTGDQFKTLLAALIFHQMFEGIGLGARIYELDSRKLMVPLLNGLAYAFMAPFGAFIGILIRNSYKANDPHTLIVEGVFNAISGGILIYMALVNLISMDFTFSPQFKAEKRLRKIVYFIAMYAGAICMSIIGTWT